MLAINDVLIVGGGPTGLMLAGDLAAAGISCAVLERSDHESNLTRAFPDGHATAIRRRWTGTAARLPTTSAVRRLS
jgi:2-polyprenyl-6-methoxyphenol hydroxylase-like FAD-dependent oxidoreductase